MSEIPATRMLRLEYKASQVLVESFGVLWGFCWGGRRQGTLEFLSVALTILAGPKLTESCLPLPPNAPACT